MSNQEAMRAEFEAWFERNYKRAIDDGHYGYTLERYEFSPHQYIQDAPHHDWRVWQASRACLSVTYWKCTPMAEGFLVEASTHTIRLAYMIPKDTWKHSHDTVWYLSYVIKALARNIKRAKEIQ